MLGPSFICIIDKASVIDNLEQVEQLSSCCAAAILLLLLLLQMTDRTSVPNIWIAGESLSAACPPIAYDH